MEGYSKFVTVINHQRKMTYFSAICSGQWKLLCPRNLSHWDTKAGVVFKERSPEDQYIGIIYIGEFFIKKIKRSISDNLC